MATTDHPTPDQPTAPDPAQLGSDTSPTTTARDDAHDVSPVLADADTEKGRPFAAAPAKPGQGSEFDQQRQEGATGDAAGHQSDIGHGQGMGRAGFNGDEDRGYDQSGLHGGLGSSGGREDLSDRQPDTDANPFTGNGQDQPPADQTQQLGLNTPSPTHE